MLGSILGFLFASILALVMIAVILVILIVGYKIIRWLVITHPKDWDL